MPSIRKVFKNTTDAFLKLEIKEKQDEIDRLYREEAFMLDFKKHIINYLKHYGPSNNATQLLGEITMKTDSDYYNDRRSKIKKNS